MIFKVLWTYRITYPRRVVMVGSVVSNTKRAMSYTTTRPAIASRQYGPGRDIRPLYSSPSPYYAPQQQYYSAPPQQVAYAPSEPVLSPTTPEQRKRRSRLIIIIVSIIVVILLLIAIGVGAYLIWYYFIRKRKNGSSCSSTSNCATGLVCDAGACKTPLNGACTVDTNCTAGAVCSGGVCKTPQGGACSASSACVSPLVCYSPDGTNQKCLADIGGPCDADNDCLKPFVCDLATDKCILRTCVIDADCGTNEVCDTNGCVIAVGTDKCIADSQCETDVDPSVTTMCSSTTDKCGYLGGIACLIADPDSCSSNLCNVFIDPVGICGCSADAPCVSPQTCTAGICS